MVALSLGLLASTMGHASAGAGDEGDRGGRGRPALIEQGGCGAPRANTRPGPSGSPGGEVGQRVTVTVPPTTIVKTDERGRIVAAMTNTGCAPRPGDDLFVAAPDGSITAVTSERIAHVTWTGDFREPGVYVPQAR